MIKGRKLVLLSESNYFSFLIKNRFESRFESKVYHVLDFIVFHSNKFIIFYNKVGYVHVMYQIHTFSYSIIR